MYIYDAYTHITFLMVVKSVSADGREWSHTTVRIPKSLHDMAIERRISMSKELRTALENKIKEGNAGAEQLPTNKAPYIASSTHEEVDD